MKIAVTFDKGNIFQHFGHTKQFKLYETENDEITGFKIVDTLGSGHGSLAGFLADNDVDVLICGGIGGGAQDALAQAGIKVFGGVQGSADRAVISFLNKTLNYNPDIKCDHHEHGEHHTCGENGCHHD
ncbi:MAG: NifB/NifX family molybdenum-iron cluster-binding protein [Eubacteriales bacterium]|nr:NifB/NifX family molybdenum-iron cluster-binding protein [Eubacteriales bacterium]